MTVSSLGISISGALLFAAPFFAGLSGAPSPVLVIFAVIFVIWTLITRPAWWRLPAGGAMNRLAARIAGVTLLRLLLVAIAFAIGRGVASLLDTTLEMPLFVPITAALVALLIARIAGRPDEDAAEIATLMDDALHRIEADTPPQADKTPRG